MNLILIHYGYPLAIIKISQLIKPEKKTQNAGE